MDSYSHGPVEGYTQIEYKRLWRLEECEKALEKIKIEKNNKGWMSQEDKILKIVKKVLHG